MKIAVIAACSLLALSCQFSPSTTQQPQNELDTAERYRPVFHFTPQANWMNDPNGMFYENGTYHLYYQYFPEGNQWGPMHWGHASSKDLSTWTEHPIAIYPDSALGYIFSGSAIIDSHNVSGLGTTSNPPVIAMYTLHKNPEEIQSQGISYSLDSGMTFTAYEGNPIIPNPGLKDFRDPKLTWDGQQWISAMTVGQEIAFYGSSNLIDWEPLSTFGEGYGNHGGVWECPELMTLETPDGKSRDVLIVSIGSGAPNQGSGTQYFIGHWDGKNFHCEHDDVRYIDWGRDNYAGVNWWNAPTPSGTSVFIGWMSNWQYSQIVPTYKWRSAMTLARTLSLREGNQELYVHQSIASNLPIDSIYNMAATEKLTSPNTYAWSLNMDSLWSITYTSPAGDTLRLTTTPDSLYLDRSKCGQVDFHPSFGRLMSAPRIGNGNNVEIIMDVMSIEILAQDGLSVMTATYFTEAPFDQITIEGLQHGEMAHVQP